MIMNQVIKIKIINQVYDQVYDYEYSMHISQTENDLGPETPDRQTDD